MSEDMQELLEGWRSAANPDCTLCGGVGSVECHLFDCTEGVHVCPKCLFFSMGVGT